MKKDTKISLCMIVKNEEKLLKKTIESAKKLLKFDDIVVADTGSADKTKEIAQSCGARVFDFAWVDDFSAARNFAAEKAANDWIFQLDADEIVVEADVNEIRRLMKDDTCVGALMKLELINNSTNTATRLYNRKTHGFYGCIHENVMPFDGIESKRLRIPVVVEHHGYLPEFWKDKGKFERNVSMLEAALRENPDDTYYLYHLGKCNFIDDRDLPKACSYFEKVLLKCSDEDIHLEYIYDTVECYGYALINTGRYREALNLLEVYYPHYKGNPCFRFLAAHIYQNNAMFIEAVECYESCIGADMFDTKGITSFLSFYNIGVILECIDMIGEAITMYRNCGDYEPALARLKALGAG